MNPYLFDVGMGKPPKNELKKALLWGRQHLKHSEDDWVDKDLVQVRQQLPREFHAYALEHLKVLLIRLRKDKLVIKSKNYKTFSTRLEKLCRDFDKKRHREGFNTTQEYDEYIHSDEWRKKVSEQKERCEYLCQLCGLAGGGRLEGHHTPLGYSPEHFMNEEPHHILILCQSCHQIADMIRKAAKEKIS